MKEVLMVQLQGLKMMKKNTKFGHPNEQKVTHHMKIIREGKVGVELGPHLVCKIMASESEKTIIFLLMKQHGWEKTKHGWIYLWK